MKPTIYAPLLGLLALGAGACSNVGSSTVSTPPYATFLAQGDSAAVATGLTDFRTALGGVLNAPNTAPADSVRREINWDGAPAALTNVDTFPLGFFNANSKRGAVYATPGTGIRVDSSAFAGINPALADQFKAFSPKKLFMAVGSNRVEVDFKVVGTTNAGLVKGFGVVFSDVDRAGSTHVEFFDANGVRIADLQAPAKSGTHEFSFVGAVFASPLIARVVITSGDAALDGSTLDVSAGGTKDLVVMDDFVYGEPQLIQ
ncbi:MAG TPA: hypothetical protein VJS20_04045 [Gemmatimonadales bacterium]|nr:hypothetical protein [Gemmatimonadales bacterium]